MFQTHNEQHRNTSAIVETHQNNICLLALNKCHILMIPLKDMNSFIWEAITVNVYEIIIVNFPQ